MFTWLAVDPVDGALNLVFHDRRGQNGTMTGVTLARSVDGGKTFVNYPLPVSAFDCCDESTFFGDYNGIDAYGGRVVAAFPVLTPQRPASRQSVQAAVADFRPGTQELCDDLLTRFKRGQSPSDAAALMAISLSVSMPHGAGRAGADGNPEREFLVARAAADGRRPARRRGVLVARRQAPRVPERARAGQSVLPDLRGRPDDRPDVPHLAGHGQDDLRVLPPGQRSDSVRLHAPRSEVEATAGRRARVSRVGQGAALRLGLRPRDGDLRHRGEDQGDHAADQRARLRRRGQLLARRAVDCVLVDARRLQSPAQRRREETARRSIRASSARSTSCAPTAPGSGG